MPYHLPTILPPRLLKKEKRKKKKVVNSQLPEAYI